MRKGVLQALCVFEKYPWNERVSFLSQVQNWLPRQVERLSG